MKGKRRNSSMFIVTVVLGVIAAVLLAAGYCKGEGQHVTGLKSALSMTVSIFPPPGIRIYCCRHGSGSASRRSDLKVGGSRIRISGDIHRYSSRRHGTGRPVCEVCLWLQDFIVLEREFVKRAAVRHGRRTGSLLLCT